ncbi:MAG TPA: phosphoribosylformylglycinamidine cyclo-ligase [Acidimicrobiales bacterium]|nr:phosphoribosylformylglycinamidine cyclo-ligase [Acidimicrobiales bacterium]
MARKPTTYAAAGVDIDAGDAAVSRLAAHARSTYRPEVISDIGGFGSAVEIPAGYRRPVLVSGTDGVGTKILVASALRRYDTIGIDLVAMCVDDIVTQGAEPLFFLDMITTGRVVPDRIESVVSGIAEGCRESGCALTGGEIAEHPDAMKPDDMDLAGFVVGVVERDRLIDGSTISPGDRIVSLASPGLRCNGYSLARRVLIGSRDDLSRPAWPGAATNLGEELLRPSVIYAPAVLDLISEVPVKGLAHVTGGGIPGNLARILPENVNAVVSADAWARPRIFSEIQRRGCVSAEEMARVFNLGVGMIAVVGAADAPRAVNLLAGHGHDPHEIGRIVVGRGRVVMEGLS